MTQRLHSLQTHPSARAFLRSAIAVLALAVLLSPTIPASHGQTLTPLDPPDLGCPATRGCYSLEIALCGGGWGGAPGGFTVQWQKSTDWAQFGWPDNGAQASPSFCTADFEGPEWQLGQYECKTLVFGSGEAWPEGVTASCPNAPLDPNTEYVFRAYAHETPNMTPSPWGGTLRCSTEYDCPPAPPGTGEEGCTYTQGYWKNHGPGSRQGNAWPVDELPIGAVRYTDDQLMRILRQPVKGNGLVSLAHQLIAAKLNIANGASNESILETIMAADQLIGPLVVSDRRRGTEHITTLRSFVANNGSLHRTAGEQYLHVNTVRHRLTRVRELTGRDPLYFSDRVVLPATSGEDGGVTAGEDVLGV
mgnify:CR=1 FL=1